MLGAKRKEEKQQQRETFGRGGTATQYQMRQNLISIGDDFWITNERGERKFKVDGKVLRVRDTFNIKDPQGRVVAQVQERMLRVKDSMAIEGPGGEKLAEVKKALIAPLRERWVMRIGAGEDLNVQGNILDHEYSIGEGGHKVAEVSKKWFRIADTYGVEVAPGQNDGMILAITVAIDDMAHQGK
jgi:uncharacterized protein YxjI